MFLIEKLSKFNLNCIVVFLKNRNIELLVKSVINMGFYDIKVQLSCSSKNFMCSMNTLYIVK